MVLMRIGSEGDIADAARVVKIKPRDYGRTP
jgi:hypothetical protein